MVIKSVPPDIRFLTYKQIAARIGNPTRATIARWIRHGSFPEPVRLGAVGGRIAWREADIDEWMTSRCPRVTLDAIAGGADIALLSRDEAVSLLLRLRRLKPGWRSRWRASRKILRRPVSF